jgi:hypothetical protein
MWVQRQSAPTATTDTILTLARLTVITGLAGSPAAYSSALVRGITDTGAADGAQVGVAAFTAAEAGADVALLAAAALLMGRSVASTEASAPRMGRFTAVAVAGSTVVAADMAADTGKFGRSAILR